MFEFLKSIFREKTDKIELKTEELDSWFKEKAKAYASGLNDYLKNRKMQIEEIRKELEEAAAELGDASIEDEEKIIPRVKNIVLSARQEYIRELNYLLKQLNINTADNSSAVRSCRMLQENIDIFTKKTTKSYYTSQHLFHKQTEKIAAALKELGKAVKELNEHINNSKTLKAEHIAELISKLNNDIKLLEEWKGSAAGLEEQRKNKEQQIKDTESEIEELKKTKQFVEYEESIKKLKTAKDEMKAKGNSIFELIAPLHTAMKKYERIAIDNASLLNSYIDDPVKALAGDSALMLLNILEKMKESIGKGAVELKDRKKEKMINMVDNISREKLEALKKEFKDAEERVEQIKHEIEDNNVINKQEELLKRKDREKSELYAADREIKEIYELIGKINIEKEKQEITKQIKELTDIEANII